MGTISNPAYAPEIELSELREFVCDANELMQFVQERFDMTYGCPVGRAVIEFDDELRSLMRRHGISRPWREGVGKYGG